jgi:hypothetical protein
VVVASTTLFGGQGKQTAARPATSPGTTTESPPAASQVPQSYAANRAMANAAALRVVQLVPLPDGAVRLRQKPHGWPPDFDMSIGPADHSLTKTSRWSVPVTANALQRYLLTHTPTGISREKDGVGGGSNGVRDVTYVEPSSHPAAYTGVSLLVQWKQVDGRSLVQAETFTAARSVRSERSYVTGSVTAVDIRRVVPGQGRHPGGPLPTVHLSQPADSVAIARLVDAANGLYGSIRPAIAGFCPYPGDPPPSITITFHTSHGVVRMRAVDYCSGQLAVRRDGELLSPTLEPGPLPEMAYRLTSTSSH